MDVMTAVLSRRSEPRLSEPAPGDEEFLYLLQAAATAPDHGKLRPWRWILVRGEGRDTLGRAFADGITDNDPRRDRAAAAAHRAPLLATLVFTPIAHRTVPEWEQLAATTTVTNSLMLLLHARGFGSMWRTGQQTQSQHVRRLLDLQPEERLLGWLYIGTATHARPPARRTPDDLTGKISTLSASLVTA